MMMRQNEILRAMLAGADRRSIGRSAEAVELVRADPPRLGRLVELLWDSDAVVRMRSADALEKLSRDEAGLLKPFRAELLGLMAQTEQQELRWHLAVMVPRLKLTPTERSQVAEILRSYLDDRSSIVKTCAMQGLWDIARQDATLRDSVVAVIAELARTGTAAMRARGRKLMAEPGKKIPCRE